MAGNDPQDTPHTLVECPVCNKSFTTPDHLRRHAKNHSNNTFDCPNCSREFKRKDLLKRHLDRKICTNGTDSIPSGSGIDRIGLDQLREPANKRRKESSMAEEATGDGLTANPNDLLLRDLEVLYPPVSPPVANGMSVTSPLDLLALGVQALDQPVVPKIPTPPLLNFSDFQFNSDSSWEPANLWDNSLFGGFDQLWQPEDPGLLRADGMPMTAEDFNSTSFQSFMNPAGAPNSTSTAHLNDIFGLNLELYPESNSPPAAPDTVEGLIQKLLKLYPKHLDSTTFTPAFANSAINHFWTSVAPAFPFIHKPTLSFESSPPNLYLMIILISASGVPAALRPDPAQLTKYASLVGVIRGKFISDFEVSIPTTALQIFVLCHIHDVWFGSAKSLFAAQCFWPALITFSRTTGMAVATFLPDTKENGAPKEESWLAWVKEEERKRMVLIIFSLDCQLSGFWSQHPGRILSVFARRTGMPCPAAEWEAQNAAEWSRIVGERNARTKVSSGPTTTTSAEQTPGHTTPKENEERENAYLPVMNPEHFVESVKPGLSSCIQAALGVKGVSCLPFPVDDPDYLFSTELILMGLLAVAWDCRTRGGYGMNQPAKDGFNPLHWKQNALSAIHKLRTSMNPHNLSPPSSAVPFKNLRDGFALANISILGDIPMLQVFAGAVMVFGSAIGPGQQKDAERRHAIWVSTNDARVCVYECARYLKAVIGSSFGVYTTWAMFLSSLVCWSYAQAIKGKLSFGPEGQSALAMAVQSGSRVDTVGATRYLDKILSISKIDELPNVEGLQETGPMLSFVASALAGGTESDKENAKLLMNLLSSRAEPINLV
ncbi:hypothetical protein T439DRAFT_324009 [Meredithblackwellia eburnea MCA 4105]